MLKPSNSQARVGRALPKIYQKVARNFSKRCSKSCTKVAQKTQKVSFPVTKVRLFLFFGTKQKYVNCTTKVRFLSIFV